MTLQLCLCDEPHSVVSVSALTSYEEIGSEKSVCIPKVTQEKRV